MLDSEEESFMGFPQLKDCGGFELLTCLANSRDLNELPCSLSAKDLKACLGGGQSKVYIRPIHKNLSTLSLIKENQSLLKEKCMICGDQFLLKDLRNHVRRCGKSKDELFSDNIVVDNDNDDDSIGSSIPCSSM